MVDGLRGGKSALIEKLHHTITDGEGSVKLSLQFLDFERDAPSPPPIDHAQLDDRPPPSNSSGNDVFHDLLAGGFRLPIGIIRQVMDLLSDPTGIPDASSAAADTVRGVVSQLSDTEQARSPLWTERSLKRRMEVLRAPFAETKAAAKRLGGTLNTAFLTAAAEAAGNYHGRMGSPVEELRASMAISTRSEGSGSNAFSLARMLVPTGKMSIARRFPLDPSCGRAQRPGVNCDGVSRGALAAVASAWPIVDHPTGRQQAPDDRLCHLQRSPLPCRCSRQCRESCQNCAVGPLAGVAYNLTLLSYNHSSLTRHGVNIDTAAVTEPELRRARRRAFARQINRGTSEGRRRGGFAGAVGVVSLDEGSHADSPSTWSKSPCLADDERSCTPRRVRAELSHAAIA